MGAGRRGPAGIRILGQVLRIPIPCFKMRKLSLQKTPVRLPLASGGNWEENAEQVDYEVVQAEEFRAWQ